MREILFRGKDANGNWHKGDLVQNGIDCVIIHKSNISNLPMQRVSDKFCGGGNHWCINRPAYKVIPETVCQYTGLTDKNGVKIFEGDILYVPNYEHTEHKVRCLVEWDELNLSFTTFSPRSSFFVLGNKFDNPALLSE